MNPKAKGSGLGSRSRCRSRGFSCGRTRHERDAKSWLIVLEIQHLNFHNLPDAVENRNRNNHPDDFKKDALQLLFGIQSKLLKTPTRGDGFMDSRYSSGAQASGFVQFLQQRCFRHRKHDHHDATVPRFLVRLREGVTVVPLRNVRNNRKPQSHAGHLAAS